jgi:hypothetical protein
MACKGWKDAVFSNQVKEILKEVIMKLTNKQKMIISDQFSNNEEISDQDLIEFLSNQGIDEAIAQMLCEEERPMFFTDPIYEIDWSKFEKKVVVLHKPIKKIFQDETGISANEIREILEAFPASYSVTIHTNNRTFQGMLNYNGKLKKGSLKEEWK